MSQSIKILVVDDSESIRELVGLTLEMEGYQVEKAVDGLDAMRFRAQSDIQLIVTDLNMPGMDGIRLIREFRKSDVFLNIPILLLTTELPTVKKEEARLAGATGWIVKPFMPGKLIDTVKTVLKNTKG